MRVVALVPAAGSGSRLGSALPKPLVPIAGRPLLAHALSRLAASPLVEGVVVVAAAGQVEAVRRLVPAGVPLLAVVPGGPERQDSVRAGLAALPAWADVVLVHDAARPLVTPDIVERVARAAAESGAATAGVRPKDTVRDDEGHTLDRGRLWLVQTPQGFWPALLADAHARAAGEGYTGTDDAVLVERLGHPVVVVPGSYRNLKVTTREDLLVADALLVEAAPPGGAAEPGRPPVAGPGRSPDPAETGQPHPAAPPVSWGPRGEAGAEGGLPAVEGALPGMIRVGFGYDVHRLVEGRPLVLGGVTVPFDRGLLGHSDADALAHAVGDALLGAVAAGDLGRHFPDTDPQWRGASSLALLARVAAIVAERGYDVRNVDATVIAERPRLAPYLPEMAVRLAAAVGVPPDAVSVKATTTNGLGTIARGEGIAACAVASVARRPS